MLFLLFLGLSRDLSGVELVLVLDLVNVGIFYLKTVAAFFLVEINNFPPFKLEILFRLKKYLEMC